MSFTNITHPQVIRDLRDENLLKTAIVQRTTGPSVQSSVVVPFLTSILLICLLRKWKQSQTVQQARERLAKETDCQAPKEVKLGGFEVLVDSIFGGYDKFKEERRSNELFSQKFREHGDTWVLYEPGNTKVVFTVDPDNIKSAYALNFDAWGIAPAREFPLRPFTGSGVLCTDGHKWEYSRGVLRPTFARKQQADLRSFKGIIENLLAQIPSDGATVDMLPLLNRMGQDLSLSVIFGRPGTALANSRSASECDEIIRAFERCQLGCAKRMELPEYDFLTLDRGFWTSCERVREFIDAHMEESKNQLFLHDKSAERSRYYLADELLREHGDNWKFVREQILNVFMAARDSISLNLANAIFLLARHPACWAKLRNEVVGSGVMELENLDDQIAKLKSLKYLRNVLNESFRSYASLGFTAKKALCDTILPHGGGSNQDQPILIRRGDTMMTNFYALHHRKAVFGHDVDVFNPDRWNDLKVPPWAFLPFGGGPRICPGQQLAMTQMSYAIAKLVTAFRRVENRDLNEKMVENFMLTTRSKNGVKISFHRS